MTSKVWEGRSVWASGKKDVERGRWVDVKQVQGDRISLTVSGGVDALLTADETRRLADKMHELAERLNVAATT